MQKCFVYNNLLSFNNEKLHQDTNHLWEDPTDCFSFSQLKVRDFEIYLQQKYIWSNKTVNDNPTWETMSKSHVTRLKHFQ